MKQLYLKRGKEDSLLRFHPWVFSGAIHHMSSEPEEGEVVEIFTSDNQYIATGHYQIGSIMVRVLTFEREPINQQFYEQHLKAAHNVRLALGLGDESYRLVHGEGDNLPGLVIDIYGDTAVMQAHSVGMHRDRQIIADALKVVLGEKLHNIYYKSETTLPYKADLHQENGFLLGGSADDIASENGLRFHVDWLHGQKTGFFIDQRENRKLLGEYSKGRNVLNMFCYTGGFSLYAMRGGANIVHSVDSSQKAIDLTNANIELNFPADNRHKAFAEDAFHFLDNMTTKYDLIILDPPAFAKHKDALRNAIKGYIRLNRKAFEQIQPLMKKLQSE